MPFGRPLVSKVCEVWNTTAFHCHLVSAAGGAQRYGLVDRSQPREGLRRLPVNPHEVDTVVEKPSA